MRKPFLAVIVTLALATLGPGAAGAAVIDNQDMPFDSFVGIPCANNGAGDVIELTGSLHVLTTSTVNNNTVSGMVHFQPQGVVGTSLIDGTKYQGTGVTESTGDVSLVNGQFESTSVNNFRIIGQGPGNNYLIHEVTHVTFNANGEVTASVEQLRGDCK